MSKDESICFKILILGDTGVGKTCLINRFCDGNYSENYVSTIGIDYKSQSLQVGTRRILLRIWDTAGQERFRTLTPAYYRGAHGILLMFDITTGTTFEHLNYWLKNIKDMSSSSVCTILVGNKVDVTEQRKVSAELAQKLANHFNIKYVEISCKDGTNIIEVFTEMAAQLYEKREHQRLSSNSSVSSSDILTLSLESAKPTRRSKSKKCLC